MLGPFFTKEKMMTEKTIQQQWPKTWKKQGFTTLSTIQEQSFQSIQAKQSILLSAPTGTGKTLAYLWPLLTNIKQEGGSQLCILLPTQELAVQVYKVASLWAEEQGLKVQLLIGTANIKRQIEQLKKHPEIVVATPGRLLELINRKKVRPHLFQALVLDEVDDLLAQQSEWNFTNQILQKVQRNTQLIFVSATAKEEALAPYFKQVYTVIAVQKDRSVGSVQHCYIETPLRKRADILRKLYYVPNFKALVFFKRVEDLGSVAEKLTYEGVAVSTLASDQSKFERELALKLFNEGKTRLLLTTDVASRGLDLPDLNIVVHYDVPQFLDNYIHRIGRVGRMGKEGLSLSLVNERERRNLQHLCADLQQSVQELYLYQSELWTEKPEGEVMTEKKKVQPSKAKKVKGKKKVKRNKNKGARKKNRGKA